MRALPFLPALVLPALAVISTASAEPSVGGKEAKGGRYVNVNGRPELLDLVTRTNCHWVEGADFAAKIRHWPVTIDKLSRIHWYFADSLKRESGQVKVCETQSLKQLERRYWDGLTIFLDPDFRSRQLAIRINSDI